MTHSSFAKAIQIWGANLVLLLSGCGSNIYSDIAVTVNVSPAISSGIDTTTNFGDSITCGVGASVTANGYAYLLDDAIDRPSTNLCRSSDEAADMTRIWVYPNTVPLLGSHQVYTVLIGATEARSCGGASGCVANWLNSLEASLTWLALPAGDKQTALTAESRIGAWAADLTNGLATTENGASLNFTVNQAVAGHELYVGYRVFDSAASNPGLAALTVDGSQTAILSSAVTTGQALITPNGTTDTIFVTSVSLGSVGSHKVSVTTISAGGALFSLQWVGVSSGNYNDNPAAPRVVVGSITKSESSSLNATIASYNSELTVLVGSLALQGMQITLAPTGTALNPATDLSDFVHPNDLGHKKLAAAFAGVLSP